MSELLPCPFCGNREVINVAFVPPRKFYFAVYCNHCDIQGPKFYSSKRDERNKKVDCYEQAKIDAVIAWNKRP